MKKLLAFIALIVLTASLCACSMQNSSLANLTTGERDVYPGITGIVWGDKTYVPYGALAAYGKRGKQIGIVDGNKDDKAYECKGYSTDEWIVTALPHDPAMLWREINVTAIPEGWQSEYEWNN